MAGWCKGSTLGSEPKDFGSIPDSATMRKGVQDMKKRLTSFLLVLALSFSFSLPAFAVDDMDYYSLPPVGGSEPSLALDWPVSPSATGDGWSSSDRSLLQSIEVALTDISRGSMLWYLSWIYDALRGGDIPGDLGRIQQNTLAIASRILDSNSLLGSINTAVSGINGFATENTLSGFDSYFRDVFATGMSASVNSGFGTRFPFKNPDNSTVYVSFAQLLCYFQSYLAFDGLSDGQYTLYHYVKNLSEILASEDDKQLAENQKENREQVEKDFLNGQSGKTSLGKGDFSNASQVGGVLNETFNFGGAAKVSDFLSGFGSAGTESQFWFSQTTANNLNAVEAVDGTQGVSTFSDDGETMVDVDPDPYNMRNIFERYDWLEGVSLDD